MDEVNETGLSLVVTKRGKPVMRVGPFVEDQKNGKKKDSIFGSLVGVMEIVGDPDSPVFTGLHL